MTDQASWPTVHQLLGLSSEELGHIDPVVMNLVVAKGIPSLANLNIAHYVQLADEWATDIMQGIPVCDQNFYRTPDRWQNDLDFSRLAIVWWYIEKVLRVAYREDQMNTCLANRKLPKAQRAGIIYTDPTDLFLHGVMETRRGTCGNMAALFVALCWRLGWPVRLACAGSHLLARYDDGKKIFNVEVTASGYNGGGFMSPSDEWYLEEHDIPKRAQECGSDLRAVTPREMLGLFVGLRARHLENTHRMAEAEPDYLLARYLFPKNRCLYIAESQVSVQCSMKLFEPGEKGHPIELAHWLQDVVREVPWQPKSVQQIYQPKEKSNGSIVDAIVQEVLVDRYFR